MSLTKKRTVSILLVVALIVSMFAVLASVDAHAAKKKNPQIKIISATYSKSKKVTTVRYSIKKASVPKGYHAHICVNDPQTLYGKDVSGKKGTHTVKIRGKLDNLKPGYPDVLGLIRKGYKSSISCDSKAIKIKK